MNEGFACACARTMIPPPSTWAPLLPIPAPASPSRPCRKGGERRWFEVEAWEEALRLTAIPAAGRPTRRSISRRSLKIGDELGGHIVSGHVDGKAEIVQAEGDAALPDSGAGRTGTIRCRDRRARRHLADRRNAR